jgi:hypothetical protein
MLEAPEGKYTAVKPTDEQLEAVLPFIIDKTVRWAQVNGHCSVVSAGLINLIEDGRWDGAVTLFSADGRDCYGYDRAGFNTEGYDANGRDKDGYNLYGRNRDGYDKAGYDRNGYDKAGFNADGANRHGKTREQVAAELVKGWTPEYLALVAAKLAERQAAAAAASVVTEAATTEVIEEAPVVDEALQPVAA